MSSNRPQDLRQRAARCLEQAKTTADPKLRAEMIAMAARFHELANSTVAYDFNAVLHASDGKMAATTSEPVVQQQQQIQPKKDE